MHSLDDDDFESKDADAARSFALAAAASGVEQIIYLGGLGKDGGDLSAHLRSRREVEKLLGSSGVPVTVLRAAVVVGAGGISWEMTRQLVKNLPAMVVPKWATTMTQPVALDDVVRYLAGVIGVERTYGQVYEIGGSDRLTYLDMLQQAAEVMNGRRVPILTVPLLTPGLSARWIRFVTDVDSTTATNLIDSMSTEVLQTDYSILDVVPGEPIPYQEAVRRAIEESGRGGEPRPLVGGIRLSGRPGRAAGRRHVAVRDLVGGRVLLGPRRPRPVRRPLRPPRHGTVDHVAGRSARLQH